LKVELIGTSDECDEVLGLFEDQLYDPVVNKNKANLDGKTKHLYITIKGQDDVK
jgi:hypothetical protein